MSHPTDPTLHENSCSPDRCRWGWDKCPIGEPDETPFNLLLPTTVEQVAQELCNALSYDDMILLIGEIDARYADSVFSDMLIRLAKDIADDLGSGLEELL